MQNLPTDVLFLLLGACASTDMSTLNSFSQVNRAVYKAYLAFRSHSTFSVFVPCKDKPENLAIYCIHQLPKGSERVLEDYERVDEELCEVWDEENKGVWITGLLKVEWYFRLRKRIKDFEATASSYERVEDLLAGNRINNYAFNDLYDTFDYKDDLFFGGEFQYRLYFQLLKPEGHRGYSKAKSFLGLAYGSADIATRIKIEGFLEKWLKPIEEENAKCKVFLLGGVVDAARFVVYLDLSDFGV